MLPEPTQDIISAVIAWVVETLADATTPLAGSYDFDTGFKTEGLPDVVGEISEAQVFSPAPPEYSFLRMQQIDAKVSTVELSLMAPVANLEDPDDHRTAALMLRDFADRLESAKLQDGTLGGRVKHTARTHRIEFRPGFVAFEDGTRGREMRFTLSVGEGVSS